MNLFERSREAKIENCKMCMEACRNNFNELTYQMWIMASRDVEKMGIDDCPHTVRNNPTKPIFTMTSQSNQE